MRIKSTAQKPHIGLWWFKSVWLFLAVFGFLSCQLLRFQKHAPIPQNLAIYKQGSFSGPVTFYQKDKKYYFHGDFLILKKDKIRVDFSAGPGVPLLTLVLNQEEVTVLLLLRKEFYKGPWATFQKQLAFLLAKSELTLLADLFFDRPPDSSYTCQNNQAGQPEKCHNQKWQIQWQRKETRLLSLKQKDSEWRFQHTFFSPEVDETLFDISIPKNFKPIFLLK